jgi:hypothetical protein
MYTELAACTNDADGDFSTIGDEDLVEHLGRGSYRSRRQKR